MINARKISISKIAAVSWKIQSNQAVDIDVTFGTQHMISPFRARRADFLIPIRVGLRQLIAAGAVVSHASKMLGSKTVDFPAELVLIFLVQSRVGMKGLLGTAWRVGGGRGAKAKGKKDKEEGEIRKSGHGTKWTRDPA
eukprot:767501-Hanusia_phi.AAC.1